MNHHQHNSSLIPMKNFDIHTYVLDILYNLCHDTKICVFYCNLILWGIFSRGPKEADIMAANAGFKYSGTYQYPGPNKL